MRLSLVYESMLTFYYVCDFVCRGHYCKKDRSNGSSQFATRAVDTFSSVAMRSAYASRTVSFPIIGVNKYRVVTCAFVKSAI